MSEEYWKRYDERRKKIAEQADIIRRERRSHDEENGGTYVDYNEISDQEIIARKKEEDRWLGREDYWSNDRR